MKHFGVPAEDVESYGSDPIREGGDATTSEEDGGC